MKMTRKRKIVIAAALVVVLGAVVGISVTRNRQDVVAVQVEKVKRREKLEARVSANGEVRPVNFYNLTAEVPGRIVSIAVHEGDTVKKGAPLVSLDPTQIESDAASARAVLEAARGDLQNNDAQLHAAENNVISTQAMLAGARYDLERTKSDLTLAQEEFKRQEHLVESGVASKSQFDAAKNRLEATQALARAQQARVDQTESQLRDARIRVEQTKAAIQSAKARVAQTEASLHSAMDRLHKTTQYAPIDGVIASLPIQVGTYVLSSLSSTALLMIADMSQVNVEVQVDESDITHVRPGQSAKVKVDALGDKELVGTVKEVGQAPISKTGQVLTGLPGASQEAKDFKVVLRLTDLAEDVRSRLRPGMSATVSITTETRDNVIAIPLQAVVERDPTALNSSGPAPAKPAGGNKDEKSAAKTTKKEVQGVFVVQSDKAVFRPVQTGIIGETDIEVTSGLDEGTEIVVGPYKELRVLKNNAAIKRESSSRGDKKK